MPSQEEYKIISILLVHQYWKADLLVKKLCFFSHIFINAWIYLLKFFALGL